MDKNRIRGVVDQGEWASCREALVVKEKLRRSGGCAAKDRALTWGDLALRLKGRRPQGRKREVSSGRSNRSSGADEARSKRRRAEREGELNAMAFGSASHQTPGQPGRIATGEGEAHAGTARDEARPACHEREGSGRGGLLEQALLRENLAAAWKRVKANKGSAGVDALSIE
jgi:hypothetical protein